MTFSLRSHQRAAVSIKSAGRVKDMKAIQNRNNMEKEGSITVYLALVLTVLLSVLLTVIEAARTNAIRFQAECVTDMALQSALAEYHREMLEQYDLFLTDLSYGTSESGYGLLEAHIQNYLNSNLSVENAVIFEEPRDLLGMTTETVKVLRSTGAADLNGEILESLVAEYMLDRYGIDRLQDIGPKVQIVEKKELLKNTVEQKRQQNEQAIHAVDTTVEDADGKKKKIPVNNPADHVNSRRGSSGILSLVTGEKAISEKNIQLKDFISNRIVSERDGYLEESEALSMTEELAYQEYLMEKCGNYLEPKEEGALDYQVEYLIGGKSSDRENLRFVVNRLLLLRETANFMYLMQDGSKQAEAEAMAAALAVVILFPELKDLIKLSILIAWAYAESVNDVNILLDGGKVPILKDSSSWKLGLENAMKLDIRGSDKDSGSEGLSYQMYLRLLLAFTDKYARNFRFMDIVEMDIRRTKGNEKFCLDHCVHDFEAETVIRSTRGHRYSLVRMAGYQK